MTDKQIIIDGVDVRRCRHYDDRYGYCEACKDDIDGASFTKCLYEDNCYYKQLKRAENQIVELNKKVEAKEQECEELKEEAIKRSKELIRIRKERQEGQKMNRNLHKQLDQLKAENDEFKKQLMKKSEVDMFFNTPMEGWSNDPCGICRYKQTLTEIKEIAERDKEFCDKCDGDREIDCVDCHEGGRALLAQEILQKISKCEE